MNANDFIKLLSEISEREAGEHIETIVYQDYFTGEWIQLGVDVIS